MGKVGGVLLCLFVALVFGGVGVFASWAIGSTLWEAHRARDWVRVKAAVENASLGESGSDSSMVQAAGTYRYAFQGRQYAGSRLGISTAGGADNIDDWHREVNAKLEDAHAAGQPITVWVNPDNPSESVLDRDVRWKELVFFVPFALAFGGVGIGALVALVFVIRGTIEGGAGQALTGALRRRAAAASARAEAASARGAPERAGQGNAGTGFLWVFAFFWNAMAFPIAFLAVPEIIENGEWAGLLVLLFPLIGVGLLWAAVAATIAALRARFGGAAQKPAMPKAQVPAPGSFAAQAARAMFGPKDEALRQPSIAREVAIAPSVARIEEGGGALTIRYSRRRALGLALFLLFVGVVLAAIAAVIVADAGMGIAAVALLLVGSVLDIWAVSMLVGTLEVRVKGEELCVDRRGLFGSRSWQIRREAISSIRPRMSYSVNGLPYFSIVAESGAERIPLGDSLKGTELADAIAQRVATALGVPSSRIVRAKAEASLSES